MIGARTLLRAGLVGIAFVAGCKVDQAAFDNRIFACNPSAKDPGCGTDESGKSMVCYPASLLDGTDFCAPSCGDAAMTLADGNQCVEGDAELISCDPTMDDSCGQSALGCLRTDVTSTEGVCTTMVPCTADKDCKDPVRSTCATTFLTQLYANNDHLQANNLYCLQKDCQGGASACSPGQSCLPLLVEASAHAPDICVPDCDSQLNCPPNHVCFQKISGPANPAICIPGLLGFICESDINCLVGKCLSDDDAVEPQNFCTIPCNSEADCAAFDSNQGTFTCLPRSDGNSYCESPYSYRGNACHTDDDCVRAGQRDPTYRCYFPSPPKKATDLGTCLRPCSSGDAGPPDCGARAGLGQACVQFYTPLDATGASTKTAGCYPGFFGVPCLADRNCAGDMTCRQAVTNDDTTNICTKLCQKDADCNGDRWTAGQSFCAASNVCVPLIAGGQPCQGDNQCQSKSCQQSADGGATAAGKCAEPTP